MSNIESDAFAKGTVKVLRKMKPYYIRWADQFGVKPFGESPLGNLAIVPDRSSVEVNVFSYCGGNGDPVSGNEELVCGAENILATEVRQGKVEVLITCANCPRRSQLSK